MNNRQLMLVINWLELVYKKNSNFDGLCILYGDLNGRFIIIGSTASNCNFPVYFGVFGMIVFGLLAGLCFLYFAFKSRNDKDVWTRWWMLPLLPLNGILTLIALIVACILSVGFKVFCDNVEDSYESCAALENTELDSGSNTGSYVGISSLSQAGAWIGFFLYLVQTAVNVLRFIRRRQLHTVH